MADSEGNSKAKKSVLVPAAAAGATAYAAGLGASHAMHAKEATKQKLTNKMAEFEVRMDSLTPQEGLNGYDEFLAGMMARLDHNRAEVKLVDML